jgi:hypothetical protein
MSSQLPGGPPDGESAWDELDELPTTLSLKAQRQVYELKLLPGCVSRAFPSCARSILAEIYLRHACSCQEIEDGNARTGDRASGLRCPGAAGQAGVRERGGGTGERRQQG